MACHHFSHRINVTQYCFMPSQNVRGDRTCSKLSEISAEPPCVLEGHTARTDSQILSTTMKGSLTQQAPSTKTAER